MIQRLQGLLFKRNEGKTTKVVIRKGKLDTAGHLCMNFPQSSLLCFSPAVSKASAQCFSFYISEELCVFKVVSEPRQ